MERGLAAGDAAGTGALLDGGHGDDGVQVVGVLVQWTAVCTFAWKL